MFNGCTHYRECVCVCLCVLNEPCGCALVKVTLHYLSISSAWLAWTFYPQHNALITAVNTHKDKHTQPFTLLISLSHSPPVLLLLLPVRLHSTDHSCLERVRRNNLFVPSTTKGWPGSNGSGWRRRRREGVTSSSSLNRCDYISG